MANEKGHPKRAETKNSNAKNSLHNPLIVLLQPNKKIEPKKQKD